MILKIAAIISRRDEFQVSNSREKYTFDVLSLDLRLNVHLRRHFKKPELYQTDRTNFGITPTKATGKSQIIALTNNRHVPWLMNRLGSIQERDRAMTQPFGRSIDAWERAERAGESV
jgi:hypothetical protein